MLIIPAVDIKGGRCVRLLRGEEGTETVFSENPAEVAKRWELCGAKLLHVIDLDGAYVGEPKNLRVIREIVKYVSIPVQVGGGIRGIETVKNYIEDIGVERIILGTLAFHNPNLLKEICEAFPGKVAVGVDVKGGKIAKSNPIF